MARNISPFAALTNEEKQIRWMEYQTVRLPYTQIATKHMQEMSPPERHADTHLSHEYLMNSLPGECEAQKNENDYQHERPIPPPENFVPSNPQSKSFNHSAPVVQHPNVPSPYQQMNAYQKSRHHQYDAVIARMKQAEKSIGSFYSCSK